MKKSILVLTLALSGWLTALPARADMLDEVLRSSGIDAALETMAAQAAQQILTEGSRRKAPEQAARLAAIVREAMSADGLKQDVRSAMEKAVTGHEADLQAVKSWLESSTGRRLTDMETAAGKADPKDVDRFVEAFRSTPPPKERMDLARRIDEAGGTSDFRVQITLTMMRAMMRAVNRSLPEDKKKSDQELEDTLQKMMAGLRPLVRQQTVMTLLFAYQGADDETLNSYLGFLRSPAGKWFNASTKKAVLDALARASKRMGEGLVAYYQEMQQRQATSSP